MLESPGFSRGREKYLEEEARVIMITSWGVCRPVIHTLALDVRIWRKVKGAFLHEKPLRLPRVFEQGLKFSCMLGLNEMIDQRINGFASGLAQ